MGGSVAIALFSGVVILVLAMGVRQSFGIFLTPIAIDLEIGRRAFGFAIAVQNLLWGLAQPLVGAAADRFGTVRIIAGGAVVYAAGLALAAVSGGPLGLTWTLGILVGLALSATTYVTVLGAIGRLVAPEQRSAAFGLCTAAGSFGMFALVPGAQALIDEVGWRDAMIVSAIAVGAIAPLAFGLRPADRRGAGVDGSQTLVAAIREAGGHRGYWLLNAGFFVCGFHVAFVATHLPAYLADNGLAPAVNAWALALIGLFNIAGSYLAGVLGGRYRQKLVLSAIYGVRALVIGLFLVAPLSSFTAILFGAAIGFLWLGTVPLTSGLVARLFGVQYLSMLYGVVFASHQVGAFLGAWGAGVAYDLLGSYDLVWLAAVGLGVFATVIHLPIDDRPRARLNPAGAAA